MINGDHLDNSTPAENVVPMEPTYPLARSEEIPPVENSVSGLADTESIEAEEIKGEDLSAGKSQPSSAPSDERGIGESECAEKSGVSNGEEAINAGLSATDIEALYAAAPAHVRHHADIIKQRYTKLLDDIFDVAEACREADKACNDGNIGSRQHLVALLPFGETMFSRYVSLAEETRFKDPEIRKHLPASISHLDELRRMPLANFQKAVEAGKINPEMKRSDIKELKRKGAPKDEYAGLKLLCEIYGPQTISDESVQMLFHNVDEVPIPEGAVIRWEWYEQEMKSLAAAVAAQPKLAVKKAKEFLSLAKTQHKAFKGTSWPYKKDETHFDKQSSFREMMDVMELIGFDDQFEKYLKKIGVGIVDDERF